MKEPFVFELGCEELPAAHCLTIISQLSETVLTAIAVKHNLTLTRPRLFVTPRRIALLADNIESTQKAIEVKGPLYDVAFENGKPTTIGEKFAASHKVSPDKLTVKEESGKKFVFVSKNLVAQFIPDIQSFLVEVIKSIVIDRPMRWDTSGLKFSRPIRWVLCMQGKKVLPIQIGSLLSQNISYGTRFNQSRKFVIPNAGAYEDILAQNKIIADQRKRKILIQKILQTLETAQSLSCPYTCDDLIDEVTFLIEYPHPLICHFSEQFLSLPPKVIATVLQKHQRYFPLYNESRKEMSNLFLVIANYDKSSDLIARGNEMVVNARLRDAVFFYEQDMTTSLDEMRKKTSRITFQEKLGSMQDKANRLTEIALKIAAKCTIRKDKVKQAGLLTKADLASALVVEFSSLEGSMGRVYAENEGIDASIAKAIEEHYQPKSSTDRVPSSDLGAILALADKIDTLFGMFSINAVPKGNSDPYGLRRAAIAITKILWEKEFPISLDELISYASESAVQGADQTAIKEFILQRAEQLLAEGTYKKLPNQRNLIKAVLFNTSPSFVTKKNILQQCSLKTNSKTLEEIIELTKRIYNIAIKSNHSLDTKISLSSLNPSEKNFLKAIHALSEKKEISIKELSTLTSSGNEFFEKNLIMAKDQQEKNRRLAILTQAHTQIERVLNTKYLFS